ncbi:MULTISPECIES: ArsI/CadI family heavy metal resistance metalloenzyme [unclassified Rhodanobacter]|uniref:ArsI/CadI family heavy metal resistance metalloenzyme n=1 Tax=unclassified Rhodanobacter TaxID=2621553 RepID=UPI000B06060E
MIKRFHVHVNVDQLDRSIRFYTTLLSVAPSVLKPDYAKWMLDDPRVNFAISQRGRKAGVDHLGLQAGDDAELAAIGARLQAADAVTLAERATTCCYARSDKFWAEDPQGVRWESFRTHGEATTYTGAPQPDGAACCGTAASAGSSTSCGPAANCC